MLSGDVFINTLRTFRLCWIGGRVGGGKTALAVRLAIHFYDRGWVDHIIGNFPSVVFTSLSRVSDFRRLFVILDEAGVWMRDGDFDQVAAYLRKRDIYVVMSSFLSPPLRARSFNVQRVLNAHRFGLDFWTYSGIVDYMRVKERIPLIWYNPREVYGLWDTSYVAQDDAGIIDAFIEVFGKVGSRAGSRSSVSSGYGDSGMESLRRVAEDFSVAAEKVSEAVSLSQRSVRRRGRGR